MGLPSRHQRELVVEDDISDMLMSFREALLGRWTQSCRNLMAELLPRSSDDVYITVRDHTWLSLGSRDGYS